jgi:peptidoglycan hydrolase-like protein with peptidoglycan-binding domain
MKRICFALLAFVCASPLVARADQTTSSVQQALKDQGFYYGDITGQKNADTTAAIRRYQIRNGLQITGEIDAETLRSLGVRSGGAPAPVARPNATPEPENDEDRGQSADVPTEEEPVNRAPQPPPASGYSGPGPRGPRPETSEVFAGTPYEIAPPDLQRHVIVGAQTLLARAGFYRSGIDGNFGPGTAAAIRAFQSRSGLPADGRLNMETLAALGLLPGQHAPRIHRRPFPLRGPVYRGQWIPG